MSEQRRWRTYHVFGPDYAEVFGPRALCDDRLKLSSQQDADLIAAAPEMLDSLKDAVRLIEHLGGNAGNQRKAIAKAIGEQQNYSDASLEPKPQGRV